MPGPHAPPVPPAPISDELVVALIDLFEADEDRPVSPSEIALMFQATPKLLEELVGFRRFIERLARHAPGLIEGMADVAGPFVPANRSWAPGGAA